MSFRSPDIDICSRAGLGAAMERGEDRDHRLKPRIDVGVREAVGALRGQRLAIVAEAVRGEPRFGLHRGRVGHARPPGSALAIAGDRGIDDPGIAGRDRFIVEAERGERTGAEIRSEEHTSELQSLMRISYAVFCLKKNTQTEYKNTRDTTI